MTDPITTTDEPPSATEATMHTTLLGQLRERLGVQSDEEVLGALDQLTADRDAAETAERDRLFAEAIAARRLTPALRDKLASKPLAEVREFLAAMPQVIPASVNQPGLPGGKSTSKSRPTTTWDGKTYAELKPSERAALKRADLELFTAMRREYYTENPNLGEP